MAQISVCVCVFCICSDVGLLWSLSISVKYSCLHGGPSLLEQVTLIILLDLLFLLIQTRYQYQTADVKTGLRRNCFLINSLLKNKEACLLQSPVLTWSTDVYTVWSADTSDTTKNTVLYYIYKISHPSPVYWLVELCVLCCWDYTKHKV